MGCTGGRYKTSNPIAATPANRFVAVANVPLTTEPSGFLMAPSLRGKNSYQDPTSARSLSARTGYFSDSPVTVRYCEVLDALTTK